MTATFEELPAGAALPQIETPCLVRLNERQWGKTIAVRTGPMTVGVRADSKETEERLSALLTSIRAPEMDDRVSPNFTVDLGKPDSGTRRLCLVYRDHDVVARRRSVDETLADLVLLLDEVPKLSVLDTLVVNGTMILAPGRGAIIFPAHNHASLLVRRPQLEAAGLEVSTTRTLLVDASSGQVRDTIQDEKLAPIANELRGARGIATGVTVKRWGVPAWGDVHFDLPPANGVFTSFSTVLNRYTRGAGRTLQDLAEVATTTQFCAVPDLSAGRAAQLTLSFAEQL